MAVQEVFSRFRAGLEINQFQVDLVQTGITDRDYTYRPTWITNLPGLQTYLDYKPTWITNLPGLQIRPGLQTELRTWITFCLNYRPELQTWITDLNYRPGLQTWITDLDYRPELQT
jgi:hypothetical protein